MKHVVGTGRYENLDDTPIALPIGCSQPETFEQTLERLISNRVNHALGRYENNYDNDDDDDFDVDDDYDGFDYTPPEDLEDDNMASHDSPSDEPPSPPPDPPVVDEVNGGGVVQ